MTRGQRMNYRMQVLRAVEARFGPALFKTLSPAVVEQIEYGEAARLVLSQASGTVAEIQELIRACIVGDDGVSR